MLPDRSLWCRNDYAVFGMIDFEYQKREGKTEIPVAHFLDLLHDTLFAPWRVVEVGFIPCATPDMLMMDTAHGILCVSEGGVWMNHMRVMYNLTTFTDLLTLIRMLTPPSND